MENNITIEVSTETTKTTSNENIENSSATTSFETPMVSPTKQKDLKNWITKNKKIVIPVVATVLVAVIGLIICLNVFTYHGIKPELDLKDAKRNLEDNDYYVTIEDDKDDLAPGVEEELRAYSDDYDDHLYIYVYEDAAYAKKEYEYAKFEIEVAIEDIKLQIEIAEYQLKHYDNDLSSEEIDELEDDLKELKQELEELQENYVYGRSGNIVWLGTKNAAEDSKD